MPKLHRLFSRMRWLLSSSRIADLGTNSHVGPDFSIHGEGFIHICKAIKTLAEKYSMVDFV